MKSYFVNLFKYDQYANELMLYALIKAGNPEKPVQLMAHLLAAQQVWLTRCLGLPPIEIALWPPLDSKTDTFAQKIASNTQDWINYLNGLNETDFETIIVYQNTKGQRFDNKLVDILGHVINHGTHHRAQIGQLLKQTGVEQLPGTDYILYLRNMN